jgi:trans-2-enoyl-CoA reductase
VCPGDDLIGIPNDIPAVSAATLSVNPCTAYRMLVDFVKLSPGDCVIQNGANSGVGQALIQIAAEMQLQTINVVRAGRPDFDQLVAYLKSLGATHVISDEFLRMPQMSELVNSIASGPPKLGLNCVGGRGFADLIKHMARGSSAVTYGGMSKQPLTVPAGLLIFNNIKLHGYWMTRWNAEHRGAEASRTMWDFVGGMVRAGRLCAPKHQLVPLEDFSTAVARAMEPFVSQKQILVLNKNILNK